MAVWNGNDVHTDDVISFGTYPIHLLSGNVDVAALTFPFLFVNRRFLYPRILTVILVHDYEMI